MAVYLISYDLRKPNQDYSELIKAIKSYGTYSHTLESTWMIQTGSSINSIYEKLDQHIDDNDSILIIEVKNNYAGWLRKTFWAWLAKRFV